MMETEERNLCNQHASDWTDRHALQIYNTGRPTPHWTRLEPGTPCEGGKAGECAFNAIWNIKIAEEEVANSGA